MDNSKTLTLRAFPPCSLVDDPSKLPQLAVSYIVSRNDEVVSQGTLGKKETDSNEPITLEVSDETPYLSSTKRGWVIIPEPVATLEVPEPDALSAMSGVCFLVAVFCCTLAILWQSELLLIATIIAWQGWFWIGRLANKNIKTPSNVLRTNPERLNLSTRFSLSRDRSVVYY